MKNLFKIQMKPKTKFSKHKIDKQRLLLSEIAERVEARQENIHNRNSMLAATQAYNLKLERQRVQSHLTSFAAPLQQQAAELYMGDLDQRIHKLAKSGLP